MGSAPWAWAHAVQHWFCWPEKVTAAIMQNALRPVALITKGSNKACASIALQNPLGSANDVVNACCCSPAGTQSDDSPHKP